MLWLWWHNLDWPIFDNLLLTFHEDNGWVCDPSGMAVQSQQVLLSYSSLTFLIMEWRCPSNRGSLQTSVMCRTMRAPLVSWIHETIDLPSVYHDWITCRIYRSTVLEIPMSWCIDKCIWHQHKWDTVRSPAGETAYSDLCEAVLFAYDKPEHWQVQFLSNLICQILG